MTTTTKKRRKRKAKHGAGSLRRVPNGFRWEAMIKGTRYSFTVLTNDRDEAEQEVAKKRAELVKEAAEREKARERGENPDAALVTFDDLHQLIADDYKARGNRSRLKTVHLREAFGDKPALAITPLAVREYRRQRTDAGAKPATVNNELAALRRMFSLAVENRKLTASQAPIIHTPDPKNARTGFFERDDFDALLAELPDELRPVMEFAYCTGWRVQSEVLMLEWSQVDFASGTVRLEPNTTKNDEGRTFPFGALATLQTLLERQRTRTREIELRTGSRIRWVFHRNGKPIKSYRGAWEAACDRAAHGGKAKPKEGTDTRAVTRPLVIGRLVHDLRRTAVRNLERAGVPRSVAMKLTGHKTESVYRRYAIASEADLREGAAKLNALHATDSARRTARSA